MAQRSRFGIRRVLLLAGISVVKNIQSLGVGGHHAVLDTVVYHVHKMAAAVGPAVQIALFGGSTDVLAAACTSDLTHTGSQRREDRVKMFDCIGLSSNHHAVSSLPSPDSAARAGIHMVSLFGRTVRCC